MIDSFFEDRMLSCQSILRLKSRRLNNPGWSYVEINKLIIQTLQNLYNVYDNVLFCDSFIQHPIVNIFSTTIDNDTVIDLVDCLYKQMEIV